MNDEEMLATHAYGPFPGWAESCEITGLLRSGRQVLDLVSRAGQRTVSRFSLAMLHAKPGNLDLTAANSRIYLDFDAEYCSHFHLANNHIWCLSLAKSFSC